MNKTDLTYLIVLLTCGTIIGFIVVVNQIRRIETEVDSLRCWNDSVWMVLMGGE